MTSYSTGVISLTKGLRAVVGTGTAWQIANIVGGNVIVEAAGGNVLPIRSVDSDTAITASLAWQGETGIYNYEIQRDTAYLQTMSRNSASLGEYIQRLNSGSLAALADIEPNGETIPVFTSTETAVARPIASLPFASVAAASSMAGFRNKIINPLGLVNQRGVAGTVVLAAGQYGHDRFKAGAGGCTYNFSIENGVTTFSIVAGSLMQIIEAWAFGGAAGAYVLGWVGTAQGRVGGGAYSASGVVAYLNGAFDVVVEWGVGTLALPQLEFGFIGTFSPRHPQTEQALCQRYYENRGYFGSYYAIAGGYVDVDVPFLVPKRIPPTFSFAPNPGLVNATGITTITVETTRTIVRILAPQNGQSTVNTAWYANADF